MRAIHIHFEAEPSRTDIDVMVRASERDAEVSAFLERISASAPEPLTVTDAEGMVVRLAPEKIILVSVSGNTTRLETETGSYTLRRTLQSMEQSLTGGNFVRISRSELINTDKIEKYDFTIRGELRLELKGGIETWVARRCIPEVRKLLYGKR